MRQSTNFNLNLPEATDAADITKVSEAIEDIDAILAGETWESETISATALIGTINSISAKKCGMVVVIELDCQVIGANAGGYIFRCELVAEGLLPINPVHLEADGTFAGGVYNDGFTVAIPSRNSPDPLLTITRNAYCSSGRLVTSFAYICVGDQS